MCEGDSLLIRPIEKRSLCGGHRFQNPFPGWRFPSIFHCIWLWIKNLFSCRRRLPVKRELEQILPVQTPVFSDNSTDEVRATWLGHASILFQLDGIRVLCDPIFSDYCSPVAGIGPKRYRPPPCSVKDLPKLDAVVISHTHYDHLDKQSVKDINREFPEVEWFVPKGCESWMRSCGCQNVREMTWWEEAKLEKRSDVKVVFTPTQHWSGRGIFDRNKALWGSWAVIGPKHRIWFAGDTGYCAAFKQVGKRYGPFDVSAIPIGAYCPRWFMHPQHVDPQDAVKIHFDVKSSLSVGMHWGTFLMVLAEEDIMAPCVELEETMKSQDSQGTEFITIGHGQTVVWDSKLSKRSCE